MKLADLATGSDWIVWIVFAIFAVLVDCLCDICCTFYYFTFWTWKLVHFWIFEKLRKRNIEQKRNAQFLAYRELCIFVNKYF